MKLYIFFVEESATPLNFLSLSRFGHETSFFFLVRVSYVIPFAIGPIGSRGEVLGFVGIGYKLLLRCSFVPLLPPPSNITQLQPCFLWIACKV